MNELHECTGANSMNCEVKFEYGEWALIAWNDIETDYARIPVSYCPFCGLTLEGEPV
ncbi:hypothetical protein [Paenibacillus sp. MMO-58]|uniref:hypothetical protein n=1 Tax=Paenibacillus sp. MMO-58 TaxID=3081290 RepID=UPI00301AF605